MLLLGLLPYATFIALFLVRKPYETRENLLYTSLIWGCFIVIITELLSAYGAISCTMFIVIWSVCYLFTLLACVRYGILWPPFKMTWRMCLMIGIVAIPLSIGFIYPPNNYDSLIYHLPRIEHWLQNGSLEPYPTAIHRQNVMAPFAEICLLNLRALTGDDIFYNSIQWIAYLNCIINVSLIAKLLGATQKGQWLAALICSSIPMAILQSSSTQNDLVVSWWLSTLAALTLIWIKHPSIYIGIAFGACLGLSCLSKGTSYPIALPFVMVFAYYALRQPRKFLLIACGAALFAITLNIPTYKRNMDFCGNMLGGGTTAGNILAPTPKNICANVLYNIAVNIEIPPLPLSEIPKISELFHSTTTNFLDKIVNYLNIDKKKFFPWSNKRVYFSFHEDTAQNMLHIILLFLSLPVFYFLVDKYGKMYGICVMCSFLLFCSLITYQPWITRLQLPIFILSSPIISSVLCNNILCFYKHICIFFMLITILTTNLFNYTRQIINMKDLVLNKKIAVQIFHNYSRDKLIFIHLPSLYFHCKKVIASASNYNTIGLITGGDSMEYIVWKMLRQNGWRGRLIHITENNIEYMHRCDIIFMLDTEEKFGFKRPKEFNPYIIELH